MNMNILHKTTFKTSKLNLFLPSIPFHLYQFSLSSSYSTKLPSHEPEAQPLSSMEEKDITRIPTEITKKKKLNKPSEIPYQRKVANWVTFVGTVKMPVKLCTSVDGKSWATTVIPQQGLSSNSLPRLWIPVIFEGDVADTAATHLKENDNVYVAGHLSPDAFPINLTNGQVKVKIHDVYFVHQFSDAMKYWPGSKWKPF